MKFIICSLLLQQGRKVGHVARQTANSGKTTAKMRIMVRDVGKGESRLLRPSVSPKQHCDLGPRQNMPQCSMGNQCNTRHHKLLGRWAGFNVDCSVLRLVLVRFIGDGNQHQLDPHHNETRVASSVAVVVGDDRHRRGWLSL